MRLLSLLALIACTGMLLAAPEVPKAERIGQPREVGADAIDIEGLYTVEGDPSTLVRIRKHNQGYRVQWDTIDGVPSFGVGMRRGSELIVGFTVYGKTSPGIVRYKIEAEGPRLVGEWMGPGGEPGTETLVFVRRPQK